MRLRSLPKILAMIWYNTKNLSYDRNINIFPFLVVNKQSWDYFTAGRNDKYINKFITFQGNRKFLEY